MTRKKGSDWGDRIPPSGGTVVVSPLGVATGTDLGVTAKVLQTLVAPSIWKRRR